MSIINKAKSIEKDIINWRRELHKIPELNLDLPLTSKYVITELEKMGINSKKLSSCSGIVGLIEGKNKNKTIAIRADMDGLPVKEETGLEYSSINENMHACGHDAHMAMLLGAAKILNDIKDDLKGNVKLLFQPGEENAGGAIPMIREGVLENPRVDAIIGQHTGNLFDNVDNGQIGICNGTMMASQDHFTIIIEGEGTHGAYPAAGIDPIVIAANVVNALQTLISREINGTDSAVLTIGKINGGTVFNVIPDCVELEGSVRALDKRIRDKMEIRIKELVGNIVKSMRGKCKIEYFQGYPPLVNNSTMNNVLYQSAGKTIGEKNIVNIEKPSMGSEDMAYFHEKVPGTYYFLGSKPITVYPHHNPRFDIDESVLYKGSAVLAQTAYDWLYKSN